MNQLVVDEEEIPTDLLRARQEDIPLLADFFVRKFCSELACPVKRLTPEVLRLLQEYPWPGNVRELENVIKRAIVLSPRSTVIAEVLLPHFDHLPRADVEEIAIEEIVKKKLVSFLTKWEGYEVTDLHKAVLRRVEKPLIELILAKAKGNRVRAARMLGINRNTLFKKIKELGIES